MQRQTQRKWGCLPWVMVFVMVYGFSSVWAAGPLVVERNLFAQDRKPPSDEVAEAPRRNTPGLSSKAFQLDGVFMYGDKKEALIRLKSQAPGKPRGKDQSPYVTVREGEKIDEYQVVKIEPKSVSFEKDGQTIVVNLFAEGKIVPPAPPVPAAPGASPPQPPHGPQEPGQGQGTMRLPRPIPAPGQEGEQAPPFDPSMRQPPPGHERAVAHQGQPPEDDGAAAVDEEEQVDEEEGSEESGS
jgi:hypothetical protein